MRLDKDELVEEINGLMDDALSSHMEWVLKVKLSTADLVQIRDELKKNSDRQDARRGDDAQR